jgi:hypothetical protein
MTKEPGANVAVEREQPAELNDAEQLVAMTQGGAYVAAGLWPVLDLRSFAKVTGPKPEGWLVKAVGLLLASIGGALIVGARAGERRSVPWLGISSAASLGGVALYYSAKRRISPVYLADAAHHLTWAALWGVLLARRSRSP